MKLKSSNNRSFALIAVLALFTIALLIKNINAKKTSKYAVAPEFEQKTPLDLIQITLNEKQYNKLKKKRNKALKAGVLETSDTDYVPATITFNGLDYKAEVRLKGDWTDHLKGDKWSFRVKLKEDKTIRGMRKFSIHHPKTRGYINEWLYHTAIKDEGLIGLRYGFLEGSIHIKQEYTSKYTNKEVGIYAIEETFDKRTLESNGRKESIILKFSEEYWWNEVKKSIEVGASSGVAYSRFMKGSEYPVTLFSESKMLQDSVMRNYFKLSKNLLRDARLGSIDISDVFDVKKLAMQNAILNLFGASHGNYIINLRFYYNPITSKLEPIAFDGNSGGKLKDYIPFHLAKQKKDSIYEKELFYALSKVSKPEYLDKLISENKKKIIEFEKILNTEFKTGKISINNLKHNQTIIKRELLNLQKKYNLKNIEDDFSIEKEEDFKIVKRVLIPEFSTWEKVNVDVKRARKSSNNKQAYKITRKNTSNSSYLVIDNIKANIGSRYQINILVKKAKSGNNFGFRIQGVYPNRVDAVFDLEKGEVKGTESVEGFKNEKASIEPIGDGWYRCSLSGIINTQKLRIILGPTTQTTNVLSWEASTKEKCEVYMIPGDLTIEEILTKIY